MLPGAMAFANRSLPLFALATLIACAPEPKPQKGSKEGVEPKAESKVKKYEVNKEALVAASGSAPDEIPEGDEGCLHDKPEGASCAPHAPAPDAEAGHFGAPFTLAASQPLGEALKAPGTAPVQVTGTVDAVCKKKGCWMVIKDGDSQARILMKDHAFAVPMDGEGKLATVEGTIASKTLSEAQVKHIEKDAGRDPAGVSGTRTEYILTATSVKLEASS